MLKGKSRIQLFDAGTGKLEHQQENTNIITNAIQDIVNDNDPLGLGKITAGYFRHAANAEFYTAKALLRRKYMFPLFTVAFGGVLLWDNTIPEDPTITMPPDGVNEVGHAGNAYVGSNTFRGSYNTNESGRIDNGYRHVWDFGTDRANGTIKCLSLTSQYGGMSGYRNDSNGEKEAYAPYTYFHFSADQDIRTFDPNLNYSDFGEIPSDCHIGPYLYLAQNSDGGFYGIKRSYTDRTKIQQVTFAKPGILKSGGMQNVTEVKHLITDVNRYSQTYVYENKIHEVYLSSTTNLVHKTYSLEGALLNTVNVTLPTAATEANSAGAYAFYYNGNYYYSSSVISGIITYNKCNATGEDLGEAFTVSPRGNTSSRSIGVFFVDNNGNGVLRVGDEHSSLNSGDADFYIYPDGNTCLCRSNNFSYVSGADTYVYYPAVIPVKTPFVYISLSVEAAKLLLAVDNRYLATINNLAAPVTKTSAQVMKVTYEITEG